MYCYNLLIFLCKWSKDFFCLVYCGRTKQADISSLSSLLRNDIKHIHNVDGKPPPGNWVDNGSNKSLSYPNCTVLREITPCKNQSRSWVRVYLCYYSESAQLDPVQSNCTFQQKMLKADWLELSQNERRQ